MLFLYYAEVAPPHNLRIFTNQHHLGHFPKAPSDESTRGLHLFVEFLVGGPDCCLLCVWACEEVPSCWLQIGVSDALPRLSVWFWLITTLISVVLIDAHGGVSIMTSSAFWGLCSHPFIGDGVILGWTGKWFEGFRCRLVEAGIRCQCCLTTLCFVTFLGPRTGPFALVVLIASLVEQSHFLC